MSGLLYVDELLGGMVLRRLVPTKYIAREIFTKFVSLML